MYLRSATARNCSIASIRSLQGGYLFDDIRHRRGGFVGPGHATEYANTLHATHAMRVHVQYNESHLRVTPASDVVRAERRLGSAAVG